ncbi:MAG: hypothetical protein ABL864_11945 [Terricaulis sp.]
MKSERTPHQECAYALQQAQKAARRGDIAGAERWSKTAERMAAAVRRLADAPAPVPDWEGEQARRAELRARIAKFVETDLKIQAWDAERDAHANAVGKAMLSGASMPPDLRPCPADEKDLERIMLSDDWDR